MPVSTVPRHASEVRILDAALRVIRSKGYAATRVEDVCAEAGLTKGSFFHHFKSKEDLALASAAYWNEVTGALFASAPYQAIEDPVARLLAYVDFRIALIDGDLPDYTCLLGTMVQDTYATHPDIRDACDGYIRAHASTLTATIADAKRRHAPQCIVERRKAWRCISRLRSRARSCWRRQAARPRSPPIRCITCDATSLRCSIHKPKQQKIRRK